MQHHPFTAFALLTALAAGQSWVFRLLPQTPPNTAYMGMAYDAARGRCVAFGGFEPFLGTQYNTTWEYDGTTWTQRLTTVSPSPRHLPAMCYDSVRNRCVLFGGTNFSTAFGDTWEWDGTIWTQRTPASAPPARAESAMCFDVARGVAVLFGGSAPGVTMNDTWEWNGTTWTPRTFAIRPPDRGEHVMAYDSARNRTVLFSGDNSLADTWEYDGSAWTQIATLGGPVRRSYATMAFDAGRGRIVMVGGRDDFDHEIPEQWEYDARGWRELFTQTSPIMGYGQGMAYDSQRARTVLYQGLDYSGPFNDTVELTGNSAHWRRFGVGCVGSNGLTPRLTPLVMPSLGATTTITVTQLIAGSTLVYLSFGGSDQNNSASLSGSRFFWQALALDPLAPRPFPGAMSEALEMNVR
jgi:hypothetical protein